MPDQDPPDAGHAGPSTTPPRPADVVALPAYPTPTTPQWPPPYPGFEHTRAQPPAAYLAPYPGVGGQRRALAWTGGTLVAIAVVIGLALLINLTFDDTPAAAPPAPAFTVPADAISASGPPGWTMSIDKTWLEFDMPKRFDYEMAWATGGGSKRFGNFVGITREELGATVTLQAYVDSSAEQLDTNLASSTVIAHQVYDAGDHAYGVIEAISTPGKQNLHQLVYISKVADSFVLAIYTATTTSYAEEAPTVEPYLSTLQAQTDSS